MNFVAILYNSFHLMLRDVITGTILIICSSNYINEMNCNEIHALHLTSFNSLMAAIDARVISHIFEKLY